MTLAGYVKRLGLDRAHEVSDEIDRSIEYFASKL